MRYIIMPKFVFLIVRKIFYSIHSNRYHTSCIGYVKYVADPVAKVKQGQEHATKWLIKLYKIFEFCSPAIAPWLTWYFNFQTCWFG